MANLRQEAFGGDGGVFAQLPHDSGGESVVLQSDTANAGYGTNLAALRTAQKPAQGTAAYSRHINRPLARRVAALAHTVGMTPNQATATSACLSATALVLLATQDATPLLGLCVAALLAAGYVMDSVDGQLARLRGSGSVTGEMLDHTVDSVKTASLHLAVLISMFRFFPLPNDAWMLVPIGYLIVDITIFFGQMTMPHLRKLYPPAEAAPSASQSIIEHPARRFILLPTDYGTLCWMFLLLGWSTFFIAGYTAMFLINALVLIPILRKWWRELRAMDRTA